MIQLAVAGAAGRMGREVVQAVSESADIRLAALIDRQAVGQSGADLAPGGPADLLVEPALGAALDRGGVDVMLDFTIAGVAVDHALSALRRGIPVVIGASGIGGEDRSALHHMAEENGVACAIIPNFAIGAVLMMRFAEEAAHWMKTGEIIEMHHDQKVDSPSGTARHTAEVMAAAGAHAARPIGDLEPARGVDFDGIPVHSVRLPGLVAHQMVLFGGEGELLTIKHDSMNRRSFMSGVLLAVRRVQGRSGLIVGLDKLMFEG